jgi:hypothetical protein
MIKGALDQAGGQTTMKKPEAVKSENQGGNQVLVSPSSQHGLIRL